MRLIFTLVWACIACSALSQTTTFKPIVTPGEWSDPATWDQSDVPGDEDIVVIPPNYTVVVKGDIYNKEGIKPNLTIQISGTLQFEASGRLDLGANTLIQLYTAEAKITSTNGSGSELIYIDGITKYLASKTQTISGPAFSNVATGNAPGGFGPGVLPVKLKAFTAQAQASRVALKWTTAEEINSSHFIVERSTNARTWSLVQEVLARGAAADYTAVDAVPASSDQFYRLKSVDKDGKAEYSHVLKVARNRGLTAFVSPNPASSQVTVSLSTAPAAPVQLQLVAAGGQVVRETIFARGSSLLRLPLGDTAPGIYTLVLREGASVIEASQLLVQ
jgi:hypothetical protein